LRIPGRTISRPVAEAGHHRLTLRADVLCETNWPTRLCLSLRRALPGIKPAQLRGALDVFALGDSQNLLKLKPEAQNFDAIIDACQIANEGLLDAGRP